MKMKKILSMMLVLVMMCTMCASFAFAADCDHSTSSSKVTFIEYGKKPSCEEPGYSSVYYCKTCGMYLHHTGGSEMQASTSKEHIEIPALGGECSWKYERMEGSSSETSAYVHKAFCENCRYSEIEDCVGCETAGCEKCEGVLEGHVDADESTHCDVCDIAIDHEGKWMMDAEGHWQICPNDEEKVVAEKTAHSFGEWVETKPATEDEVGAKERSCECGYKEEGEIAKLPHVHKYDFEEKVLEPTCKDKGYTEQFCKCGESQKVNETAINKEAHRYGEWIVLMQPTTMTKGEKYRECEICGDKEFGKIDEIVHVCDTEKAKRVDAVAPGCLTEGYEGNLVCSCGKILEVGKKIDALGHDMKDVEKKAATCTEDGYEAHKACSRCDYTEGYKVIEKHGHVWDEPNSKGQVLCKVCKIDKNSPQTGDTSNLMFWTILMLGSVLCAAGVIYNEKKHAMNK